MIAHRFAAALAAGCCAVLGAAAVAHAVPVEERVLTVTDTGFIDAFNGLGIQTTPDLDIPGLGHQVCDMMTAGLKTSINPVPVVRGTVSTLQSNGLTKPQAIGLMRASVTYYCPLYARYIGR